MLRLSAIPAGALGEMRMGCDLPLLLREPRPPGAVRGRGRRHLGPHETGRMDRGQGAGAWDLQEVDRKERCCRNG